jgi:hypothetical protein
VLPETLSTLEQGFEIRLELRPVLVLLGELRRALECLREAEGLAERLNDDRRRGQACAVVTSIHSHLGELDDALVAGARALEIAGRLGDFRLRILTTTYLGQAHYHRATTNGWSSWLPITSRHCPPTRCMSLSEPRCR